MTIEDLIRTKTDLLGVTVLSVLRSKLAMKGRKGGHNVAYLFMSWRRRGGRGQREKMNFRNKLFSLSGVHLRKHASLEYHIRNDSINTKILHTLSLISMNYLKDKAFSRDIITSESLNSTFPFHT